MTTLENISNSDSYDASSYAQNLLASLVNGSLGPQPKLEKTLRLLAAQGPQAFYNGSIGLSIVNTLQNHGVTWEADRDLSPYQVQMPQQIEVCL